LLRKLPKGLKYQTVIVDVYLKLTKLKARKLGMTG